MSKLLEKDAIIHIMDYVYADKLNPDQLLEGDLIEISEDHDYQIVEIKTITSIDNNWLIEAKDEYGDLIEVIIADDEKVRLFVLK